MHVKLTDPVKIGKMTLKNRMYAAPMVSLYADEDGNVTPRLVDIYREKAGGGWGLVCVEAATVRYDGRLFTRMLGIYKDQQIAGLNELAEAISDEGGKSCIQIMHGGRQANSRFNGGVRPIGPSSISPWPPQGLPPREMTQKECEEMSDCIAMAAGRAREAGFDSVQLHAAHGFLMQQFLSPYTNQRKDAYGHKPAFLLEVISKVRMSVGNEYPLGLRLSADEFLGSDGLTADYVIENIIPSLEKAGIDWFDISAGVFETLVHWIPPIYFKKGYLTDLAAGVKEIVNVPVSGVGRINDPDLARKLISENKVDMVAFGRQVLADSAFPRKVLEGREKEIRKCIACDMGCTDRLLKSVGIKCAVNYEFAKEDSLRKVNTAVNRKKILIVGGGVAGMEAAGILAIRGHSVFLKEKTCRLGGLVRLAASIPRVFTHELFEIVMHLESQIKNTGVNVETGINVDMDYIKEMKPDAVIIATGSIALMPASGMIAADAVEIIPYDRYIMDGNVSGENIIVIGGIHGAETALSLAKAGKHVKLLEESLRTAETPYIYYGRMLVLQNYLKENNVDVITDVTLKQINGSGVIVADQNGEEREIAGDTVIAAFGRRSDSDLSELLAAEGIHYLRIGDCDSPGNIMKAVHQAARTARRI